MVGLESTLPWNNHFIADIKVRPVIGSGVPEKFLDAHRTRSQNTSMCGESSQGGEGLDWVLYIRIVFSCFRAFGANTFICGNKSHERAREGWWPSPSAALPAEE